MKKKEYSNGEVTVIWQPEKCIHSGICVKGLPKVFKPEEKPWINIQGASTEDLVHQVKQCPSGALGLYMEEGEEKPATRQEPSSQTCEVMPNGPLMVYGNIEVKLSNGEVEKKFKTTAFCRCGSSKTKPYCDGTHKNIEFKD
ncbi:(4Fe-4S)-binding protein [Arthrospiribacter ruber]|uniref:Iron-binding zinc finger CDGSH type domain-containing protein n=1 Tax=Arthrospiribacter ruber TaxID=2487934 RepID=A0A951IWR6_9BACT|nr:(4Fe-4S)-binding protein [Arthrospiribacter ruber]MBW3468645.1 hypothetical protein [Arthrospiribacter ruber]